MILMSPQMVIHLIDLVLTSSPSQILNCSTIPPLCNSDHRGIHLTISCKPHHPHQPSQHRQTVWRYMHADFEKACEMISETDWDALASEDIDQYCSMWQNTFLSIMNECIPKRVLPPRRRNLPWLNKGLVQSIRRRNCYFKKAKRSIQVLSALVSVLTRSKQGDFPAAASQKGIFLQSKHL